MWTSLIVFSLIILLTAYFFVLPLSKKRPVLVRSKGLTMYIVLLATLSYVYVWESIPGILVVASITTFLTHSSWLVYGVTEEKIVKALEKAAQATRATVSKQNRSHIICDSASVRILIISKRLNLIIFKQKGKSKKISLTKDVMKKFIQNYFI